MADRAMPQYAEDRFREDDLLPVRSKALSPGTVKRRLLNASGLPAFFLIGDDALSRSWLRQRLPQLTRLKAAGLVVNVESNASLTHLRQLAPGLTLSPVSADDLAQRLQLQHYPVLVTASSIEQ
ncbi:MULTISPECIES: integrating conjugative element protein [unclassified Pseudomonas]|uniref:integrating conjugative element protein n=1 Tax=unclassified Pseudomonas TaxID=196821 RepID=UPI0021099DFB|nr:MULTISPECIES: integrating conjugative element protein [unclassified Pseudomonas]UZE21007.1 integrating conjugative element protein [Pseudomonas sp. B21-054]